MEEAKKKRSISKGQFTRAEGRLLTAIDNEADSWTLSKRYDDLKERWNTAQDAHDEYMLNIEEAHADSEEA